MSRAGCELSSWPVLLELYARLRPGITVLQWMQDNQIQERGIDVRRFITFGIIKGFLRRVHRWPIHIDSVSKTFKPSFAPLLRESTPPGQITPTPGRNRRTDEGSSGISIRHQQVDGKRHPTNDESNITLRSGPSTDSLHEGSGSAGGGIWKTASQSSLQTSGFVRIDAGGDPSTSYHSSQRGSLSHLSASHVSHRSLRPTSGSNSARLAALSARPAANARGRLRQSHRSQPSEAEKEAALHRALREFCDGMHHADELQIRFEMGWTRLEQHLQKMSGLPTTADGKLAISELTDQEREDATRGDFGKIVVVLR